MSKRLTVLENSLAKKNERLNQLFDTHFKDVKSANGQPLNDKRNGAQTFKRWDKQNDAIRNQQASIELTKRAIEREKVKIANVDSVTLPTILQTLLNDGKITQWRKYPNRFFVVGVQGARLVFEEKTQLIKYAHLNKIKDQAEYTIFRDLYNHINATHNKAIKDVA